MFALIPPISAMAVMLADTRVIFAPLNTDANTKNIVINIVPPNKYGIK